MLHLADKTLRILSMLLSLSLSYIAYAVNLLTSKHVNQPTNHGALGHLLYSIMCCVGLHLIVYLWCHLICSQMSSISSYLVIEPSDLIDAHATLGQSILQVALYTYYCMVSEGTECLTVLFLKLSILNSWFQVSDWSILYKISHQLFN